jgi:hypothetical protein
MNNDKNILMSHYLCSGVSTVCWLFGVLWHVQKVQYKLTCKTNKKRITRKKRRLKLWTVLERWTHRSAVQRRRNKEEIRGHLHTTQQGWILINKMCFVYMSTLWKRVLVPIFRDLSQN